MLFLGVIFAIVMLVALYLYQSVLYVPHEEIQAAPQVQGEQQVQGEPQVQGEQQVKEQPQAHGLELAPEFAFADADGNELRLSDFLGTPVVLNFWATWCPACVVETPYFEALYHESGDDLQILKVNLIGSRGETQNTVEEFMQARNYTMSIFYDTQGEGAQAYQVRGIPVTFFITADGYIASEAVGSMNTQSLQNGVALISN
jgi:peroxiredoxin